MTQDQLRGGDGDMWMDVTNREKCPRVTYPLMSLFKGEKQIDIRSRLCLLTTEDKDKDKLKLFTCFTIVTIRWILQFSLQFSLHVSFIQWLCVYIHYSASVFHDKLGAQGSLENTTRPSLSINGQNGYRFQAGCKQAKTNYQENGDLFFFLAPEHVAALFEKMLSSHQSHLCGINFSTKILVECNKLAGWHEGCRNGRFPFEMMLRM